MVIIKYYFWRYFICQLVVKKKRKIETIRKRGGGWHRDGKKITQRQTISFKIIEILIRLLKKHCWKYEKKRRILFFEQKIKMRGLILNINNEKNCMT